MKKILALCICISFMLTQSGCSLGDVVDQFVSVGDSVADEPTPDKPRVYMDEIHGTLLDFTGNELTVQHEDDIYTFDVAQATLECEGGMITGDEISVIYEGQLTDTDTSNIKTLKVVDEYHKKTQLEDQIISGQVQTITPNTLTIKDQNGNTTTYPITGCEQYYQNGIHAGVQVYIHYKGQITEASSDSQILNGTHLKVISISDIEPLHAPTPTPTPASPEEDTGARQLHATIRTIKQHVLRVVLDGTKTAMNINISAVPCYFKGGIAPGSGVTVTYQGEFNGSTTEGLTILSIISDDPETLNERNISFTVSGEIIANTANTITLLTSDGAIVTCNTTGAKNSSTGGLLTGSSVKVTFNPTTSKQSNIYTCLKIEDA